MGWFLRQKNAGSKQKKSFSVLYSDMSSLTGVSLSVAFNFLREKMIQRELKISSQMLSAMGYFMPTTVNLAGHCSWQKPFLPDGRTAST